MPNEEIITGLKNAIARKETLDQAIRIMINSGYNEREVQEASKFIGRGVLNMEEPKPDEQLTMPEEKGFFSKLKFWKKKSSSSQQKPLITKQSEKILQQTQHIQQPVKKQQDSLQEKIQTSPTQGIESKRPLKYLETKFGRESLTKQLKQIKPKKSKHLREIILVIILLILLIILAVIIFFKGTIFGWFS